MSLIINQGKQDTSNDSKDFPIIVENDVTLQITAITLSKFKSNALNVEFKILSGTNKNRIIFDTVEYDPKSQFSWKYRSLRNCAGVPYKDGEPANIDIEALLVNKVIKADLSARAGKDSAGNVKDYQNIKYKKYTQPVASTATAAPVKQAVTEPEKLPEEVIEDSVVDANDIFAGVPIPDDSDWD